jgi:hypothetical protein
MRDPQAGATVATRLREAGYEVDGRVMAVDELISTLHIHKRYELQMQGQGVGRFATQESMRVHLLHYPPVWSASSCNSPPLWSSRKAGIAGGLR